MFYFPNPLLIGTHLLPFVPPVGRSQALLFVGRGMRVENPNIKEGPFVATTPEPISRNVQPSSIFRVGRSTTKDLTSDRLQMRFHRDIRANLRQPGTDSITYLVVA